MRGVSVLSCSGSVAESKKGDGGKDKTSGTCYKAYLSTSSDFFGSRNKTSLTMQQATIIIFPLYEVRNFAKPDRPNPESPQLKQPSDAHRN